MTPCVMTFTVVLTGKSMYVQRNIERIRANIVAGEKQ
jgi:hypothetical protein